MAYAECLDPNDVALNYDIQGGGGGGSGNERKKKVSATLSASSEKLVGCNYFFNQSLCEYVSGSFQVGIKDKLKKKLSMKKSSEDSSSSSSSPPPEFWW